VPIIFSHTCYQFPIPAAAAAALLLMQTNLLATCGADATVQLFDLTAQRQLPALTGHSKRVTAAVWGEDSLLLTASNDKTVRFWRHSAGDDAGGWGVEKCKRWPDQLSVFECFECLVGVGRRHSTADDVCEAWFVGQLV
jgi:hypothetical protein